MHVGKLIYIQMYNVNPAPYHDWGIGRRPSQGPSERQEAREHPYNGCNKTPPRLYDPDYNRLRKGQLNDPDPFIRVVN